MSIADQLAALHAYASRNRVRVVIDFNAEPTSAMGSDLGDAVSLEIKGPGILGARVTRASLHDCIEAIRVGRW